MSTPLTEEELEQEFVEVQAAVINGWREPDDPYWRLLLTAHQIQTDLAACKKHRDNLDFELRGLEIVRRRDNEYLLGERDKALAKIKTLSELLERANRGLKAHYPPGALITKEIDEALDQ